MADSKQTALRSLPSVDRLLADPAIEDLIGRFSRQATVATIRELLAAVRNDVLAGANAPSYSELIELIAKRVEARSTLRLGHVINATGVIIHTNLGRAPLSDDANEAARIAASGYSNLEFDLEQGERGSRHDLLRELLKDVTGAEDAIAVNNNAGAVLLALNAVAAGRDVIVSRGQAVEIGGGFRVPDVLRQSGANLVEVGTTNRTYISDYEGAITAETAALLRVHTSNFRVVGFTHEVPLAEMVDLAANHGITVIDDLGSGCFLDTSAFGLAKEPIVQESVAAGADLVCFSGDKLLGGPQAGIIVGKRELVQKLARHPLARALRIDKLDLAALSATLLHYHRGDALEKIPIWQMIAAPLGEIERRAQFVAGWLGDVATVEPGESTVGGGSLPGETLPSYLVAIGGNAGEERLAVQLERRLRLGSPAVIARIERHRLLLDLRTVLPKEEPELLEAVKVAISDVWPSC